MTFTFNARSLSWRRPQASTQRPCPSRPTHCWVNLPRSGRVAPRPMRAPPEILVSMNSFSSTTARPAAS
eukprot:1859646-Heterocapsa_arctica.AAC.1